jgi:hypothetical protein
MTNKAKLMICLIALSVALAGYVSCLIASHIPWTAGLLTAPAILPGLSFGLVITGWLLHRGWVSRRKAVVLIVASTVAYFAAYWSAFYTVVLFGKGMLLAAFRFPYFHAGMIGGVVGTCCLTASLAVLSSDFRRKGWIALIVIGTGAGGALVLAGLGATSSGPGSLANPGDRVFIFVWQLLVSGYIGMLLWTEPAPSAAAQRSRFRSRAALAVLALLLLSFLQAAIGYARRDKEITATSSAASNSKADLSTPRKAVQAFEDALENNDMDLARSIALGEDQRLIDARTSHASLRAWSRMEVAKKKRFDSEQAAANERDIYLKRWTTAEEHINGETATVGTPRFVNGQQSIWGGFDLRKIGGQWNIDLEASDFQHFWAGKYGIDQPAAEQWLKKISEITDTIEKGGYKDEQEAIVAANDAATQAKARLEADIAAGRTTVVENKNGRIAPLAKTNFGDAKTWGESYRNAKFITRGEFLRRVSPVRLRVRQRSGVSDNVRNLEDIVRASATAHGWSFTSDPGAVEMVVDADLDRAKMTTTEYTNFGPVEQSGYHMAYAAGVQIGFMLKANCLRGDKFAELSVYPSRSWNVYYGYMGDLVDFEATYAKAFREAMDGMFNSLADIKDSDDPDDVAAWNASLWPAARDAQMYKSYLSPLTGEPGAPGRTFYGITKFDLPNIDLLDEAKNDFNAASLQRDWSSELTGNSHEIDPTSPIRIQHQFSSSKVGGGLLSGSVYYFHQNSIRVWQRNVVFSFKGELRRGKACIWSELECAIALPGEYGNVGRDLLNRNIRSAAKEFALRR